MEALLGMAGAGTHQDAAAQPRAGRKLSGMLAALSSQTQHLTPGPHVGMASSLSGLVCGHWSVGTGLQALAGHVATPV